MLLLASWVFFPANLLKLIETGPKRLVSLELHLRKEVRCWWLDSTTSWSHCGTSSSHWSHSSHEKLLGTLLKISFQASSESSVREPTAGATSFSAAVAVSSGMLSNASTPGSVPSIPKPSLFSLLCFWDNPTATSSSCLLFLTLALAADFINSKATLSMAMVISTSRFAPCDFEERMVQSARMSEMRAMSKVASACNGSWAKWRKRTTMLVKA